MQIILSSIISARHYYMSIDIIEKDGLYSIISSIERGFSIKIKFLSLEEIKTIYLNIIKEKMVNESNCKIILYNKDSYYILELKGYDGKYYITYRNEYVIKEGLNNSSGSRIMSFEEAKLSYIQDIEGLILKRI